jgi:hypothetical protein
MAERLVRIRSYYRKAYCNGPCPKDPAWESFAGKLKARDIPLRQAIRHTVDLLDWQRYSEPE